MLCKNIHLKVTISEYVFLVAQVVKLIKVMAEGVWQNDIWREKQVFVMESKTR